MESQQKYEAKSPISLTTSDVEFFVHGIAPDLLQEWFRYVNHCLQDISTVFSVTLFSSSANRKIVCHLS